MESSDSVTAWIARLKQGDQEAAERLWERYFNALVRLARGKLATAPRRAADEEDVALSVFETLCRRAASGRLQQVTNRDDLWWLLLAVTKQEAINQRKHETRHKRGKGQVRVETDLRNSRAGVREFSLDDIASEEPTPEFLALIDEQHRRLMDVLPDDTLRSIALWRMEGYTNDEIAEKLGLSTRTVERDVRLIRIAWSMELGR